jgi:16S rRNA (uracil1498-N3)-methyltransferase
VTLSGADARKLTLVLRRASGDPVELSDSAGNTFLGRVRTSGHVVGAELTETLARATEPSLRLVLAQAIPKGAKMDFVVEKATELGVAQIVPLLTERSATPPPPARLERWRRLARAAAQQSGRTTVPAVTDPRSLDAFAARPGADRVLVPWELADRIPLKDRLASLLTGVSAVAIAIGPEGGFARSEVERAVSAGAIPLSLGARILRTETAGLVMLSALLYASGDL